MYCNQKGDLGIIIDTREAVVRIKNSKIDYYIDSDGLIMPLSSNYTARVIMITGDVTITTDLSSADNFSEISKID